MTYNERIQQRLEAILNSIGDAIIFTYPDARIRQVNPTFDTLFGYTPDEIHRGRVVFLTNPDYQDALADAFERVQTTGATERLTLEAQRKDGSTFAADWVLSAIQDDEERGVVCIVRDVSEDRRVKRSLKSTKEYLRLLVNAAPVTLQIIDPTGQIVLTEGRALERVEHLAGSGVGQAAADIYATVPAMLGNIERALQGEVVREVHHVGEYYLETMVVPSWDEMGELEHVIMVQVDITEHKRAELELARNERRYRALFEQSNDAVFIMDTDGLNVDVNQQAVVLTGYSKPELLTMHCYELVVAAELEACRATFGKLLNGAMVAPYERHFRRKDGTVLPVEVNIELVRNGGGRILHIQSIVRDISERRAEYELRLEQDRLQVMTQFIQNAAHEFRTPLSVISTNAFLMRHETEKEQMERRLTAIEGQVNAMARLLETLSRVTRLESVNNLPMQEDDLLALLQLVRQTMTATYADKGLYLIEDYPPQARLMMNVGDMYSALYEITDNAFRFTPAGGSVRLGLVIESDTVVITVEDTGVGIPRETLPHVFEKLYREDAAHSTRGFGLGLSIAKRVVELHGGLIEVESVVKRGTRVTMYLPKL